MSTARGHWRAHLKTQITEVLNGIPPATRADVYVVTLTAFVEDFDGRKPVATLAWNTTSHLESRQAEAIGNLPMTAETDLRFIVEWSPYEFIERAAGVIALGELDPEGVELRRKWIEELGLWYDDDYADFAADQEDIQISRHFLALIIEVTCELHLEGRLQEPFLIDVEDVYDNERRALNRAANPADYHVQLDRWSTRGDYEH